MKLNWKDFDRAVDVLARRFKDATIVYGEPRGGMNLAVALSHRLNIPLTTERVHQEGLLWVDDLVNTGETMSEAIADMNPTYKACWVAYQPHALECVLLSPRPVIFPWEAA